MNAILFFNLQTSLAIATLLWVALYTHRVRKIIVFLCRLVLKRNKMHDREIALWNARMRINVDANLWENEFKRISNHTKLHQTVCLVSVYSEERDHFACGVQASGDWFKILAKESFEMPQPAAALSITNMMNPHLFFFFRSFHFFSCRRTCLALY